MRLTSYTDYALRALMFLAMNRDHLVTIQEIADAHGIAKNHLTKVVHQLGQLGVVETIRGRNGGLRLGMEPEQINIGEVVRNTEGDFSMAACFEKHNASCLYTGACALKGVLARATDAFLDVLDGVTLDRLVAREALNGVSGQLRHAPVKTLRVAAPAPRRRTAGTGKV